MNFWTMGSQHIMVSVCVTQDFVKWNVSAVHNLNALTYSNKEKTAICKETIPLRSQLTPEHIVHVKIYEICNKHDQKKEQNSNVNWEKSTRLEPRLS